MSENDAAKDSPRIRRCEKCGCELASGRHKLCADCRRQRAANRRKAILGVGGTLVGISVFIIKKVKRGGRV